MDSDASIPNREVLGQEILLYDRTRRPHDWSEVLLERQCAVFLRNARLGVPVGADLKPRPASAATCIVFDFIADAESLCRGVVAERPDIECEILDCEGRANPPLMTITSAHSGGDAGARGGASRRRRWIAAGLICAALPLFVYDFAHHGDLVLTIIGINLIVAALRLLFWDSGEKQGSATESRGWTLIAGASGTRPGIRLLSNAGRQPNRLRPSSVYMQDSRYIERR